jgi:N-methylhydantoinase A
MLEEGAAGEELAADAWIDARYRGQSFELGVPADDWRRRFHEAHLERYGYRRDEAPVEAVTLRVVVTAPPPVLEAPRLEEAAGPPPLRPAGVVSGGSPRETMRVWRRDLRAGHELAGPLVIQEYSGTTWVPSGWRALVDGWGCLHLEAGT